MKYSMKAQIAVEYMIIVAVVLGAAITFFYYTNTYSSESINKYQAKESIEVLAKAIDYVYALGPGTQTTVVIEVPPNVVSSYVTRNEIGFKIGISGKINEVYEITKASVSGSLPSTPGRHFVIVNSTGSGVVIGAP